MSSPRKKKTRSAIIIVMPSSWTTLFNLQRSSKLYSLNIHSTGFRYQAFQVYKPDECSENSKLLHLWKKQECERRIQNGSRELEKVQVKTNQQFTYIYCYYQTITIGKKFQRCENVIYRICVCLLHIL